MRVRAGKGREKRDLRFVNPESVTEAEVAAERKWAGNVPHCTFIYSKEDVTKHFTDTGSFCKYSPTHRPSLAFSYELQNIHSLTT